MMAIPSECKMPDLSCLDSPLWNRLIVQLLVGEKGLSRKAQLYRRNFVRLIDKALEEYNNAREVLLAQVKKEADAAYKFLRSQITWKIALTLLDDCICY